MQKAPNRPKHEVTQSYNDGVVKIYEVRNIAEAGYTPKKGLALRYSLRFDEQRLGINRLYMSRQNQAQILRVLRVQRVKDISPQDVVIVEGRQFKIDTVQSVKDIYPPSLDLALTATVHEYGVVE
ncbi:hypothetical protein [Anaerotignum sp.]|uniref:hypothetical protein n=1 Tax=Anaerotignum sp. TaxID=2039241 RepID=UPI00289B4071|nr:hypothetical protein [Anaerotignum sp.]